MDQSLRRGLNKLKNQIKKEISSNPLNLRDVGDSQKMYKGYNALKDLKKHKKSLVATGLITAGIGSGAIIANTEKKAACVLLDKLYKYAQMTVPTKEEAKEEKDPIKPKNDNAPAQDDIDCEVCGFKGQPTYDGFCPDCGALGGKKISNFNNENPDSNINYWEDPYIGISVEDADYMGRMSDAI